MMGPGQRRKHAGSCVEQALCLAAFALASVSFCATSYGSDFVAGTTPDRRPENAPRVEQFEKTPVWYAEALRGIEPPVPHSLGFLDNQGGWFTPFNRRGMTGPYDIRGLHAEPPGKSTNSHSLEN
ncbi:MAG: hypothetical protein JNL45_08835 [Hyphomicrobium sp.]|jgi:hypothetical protein|nr:hypothetical protein [Hyphomicrobium sp.]